MRLIMQTTVAASAALLAGCPGPLDVQCLENSNCNRFSGGICAAAPSGNQWCTYPDPACPNGYRYSDLDVGDGLSETCVAQLADAGIDVRPPDALAGQAKFDVAYIDTWDIGTDAAQMNATGWLRIANMATDSLDLSTMTFTTVNDNHPQITVSMAIENSAGRMLAPGFTGGDLYGGAHSLIVVDGKMNEPEAGLGSNLARITVANVPPSGTWLFCNAAGILRIANASAQITVTIRQSGVGTAIVPARAQRASSAPI